MTPSPAPPCGEGRTVRACWVPLASEQACSSCTGMWAESLVLPPGLPSGYSRILALRVGSVVALLLASGFNFDEVHSIAFSPRSLCLWNLRETFDLPRAGRHHPEHQSIRSAFARASWVLRPCAPDTGVGALCDPRVMACPGTVAGKVDCRWASKRQAVRAHV